jgi:hypothetical protein
MFCHAHLFKGRGALVIKFYFLTLTGFKNFTNKNSHRKGLSSGSLKVNDDAEMLSFLPAHEEKPPQAEYKVSKHDS